MPFSWTSLDAWYRSSQRASGLLATSPAPSSSGFTCGEPFQELIGLRDTEQVLPGDGLGLGVRKGGEPDGQSSPMPFSAPSQITCVFLQRQAALSHHITSGACVTARPPLLSLLFPSLRHLPPFPSLPFVFVCLSGLSLDFHSCPGLLALGLGLTPRIAQTPLYLTSVPLGRVLSLSPLEAGHLSHSSPTMPFTHHDGVGQERKAGTASSFQNLFF